MGIGQAREADCEINMKLLALGEYIGDCGVWCAPVWATIHHDVHDCVFSVEITLQIRSAIALKRYRSNRCYCE